MFNIVPIPALRDNYIWALHNDRHAVIVDPAEAAPVLSFLKMRNVKLAAILCTHHHNDHTGGIAELLEVYNVPVYAPRAENIFGATHPVEGGDTVQLPELGVSLEVLDVRGHTRGHIAYYGQGSVFCGDTLFGCGCGRLFEGTAAQLFDSLQRLAQLPDDTKVCCAHEYTETNIRFALACEPDNPRLRKRAAETRTQRASGMPTVPSTIALEKATNPFLRCKEEEIIHSAQQFSGSGESSELAIFTALRKWKDHFVY
jgi:hydroxyacylglutathione hydrolase